MSKYIPSLRLSYPCQGFSISYNGVFPLLGQQMHFLLRSVAWDVALAE